MERWNLNDLKVPFEKPPVATYMELPPGSKTVDLANLCRRLIAEFQYIDDSSMGNFVEVFDEPPGHASDRTLKLFKQDFKDPDDQPNPITRPIAEFLGQLHLTRYRMVFQYPLMGDSDCKSVTAKEFVGRRQKRGGSKPNLKPEEVLAIYWRLRMRYTCDQFSMVLGQIVEDFRKLEYKGFLLPNGKVVPFECMHQTHFCILPKELHLLDYKPCPEILIADFPLTIEDKMASNPHDGRMIIHHIAMAFNLPEKDDEGLQGKLMIIDPTCAQFGMKGVNSELIYWGPYQDYMKALPVKEVIVKGFKGYDYMDPEPGLFIHGPLLIKGTLANLNLDSCGYCGEVEREENPEMKLKNCSKCMKVFYCDVLCQKLGWRSHKLECKLE